MGFAVIKVFIALNHTKRKKPQPRSWGFFFAEGRRTETFSKIAPDGVYIPSLC